MITHGDRKRPGASHAFTLVVLLLTTVLFVLLLGAMVYNFSSLHRGSGLEEGAAQFESLLRFARAQAANTGRKVQVNFEEDIGDGFSAPLGNLRVLWEPDPLDRPGEFEELPEAALYVRGVTDLVSVEFVRNELTDETPIEPPADEGALASFSFLPLYFFPDGSSESAEILLASRSQEDERLVSVRLAGVTGSIRRRIVTPKNESGEATELEAEADPMAEDVK